MPEAAEKDWRDRPVYWSTLRYLRAWWATDGVHVALAKDGMDPPLLRRIADEYRVNRLIAATGVVSRADLRRYPGLGSDRSAGILCRLLDRVRDEDWPATLPERAEACRVIMNVALKERVAVPIARGPRQGEPKDLVSAITKLVWFLRPGEWTVFDDLAATGLGIPGGTPRKRMTAFYDRLHELDAVGLVRRIQPIIGGSVVPALPAMRILDTLLMARAQPERAAMRVAEQNAFLGILPQPTRDAVHALAKAVQAEADRTPNPLTSPDRPGKPERRKAKR